MRRSKTKWLSGFGVVVLIGGLVLANYGTGVPSVGAQAAPGNPLTVIVDKLNQILTAIGGIHEGNHTLRWDTNNPSASRFVTAFTGAVLDKNTGLVWEQAPDTTTRTWGSATLYCLNKAVPATGGTRGWRLPSVAELSSLIDPSLAAPFVPASVFTGVQSGFDSATYWSASTIVSSPAGAWNMHFDVGTVGSGVKSDTLLVWCVRGGMNADQY